MTSKATNQAAKINGELLSTLKSLSNKIDKASGSPVFTAEEHDKIEELIERCEKAAVKDEKEDDEILNVFVCPDCGGVWDVTEFIFSEEAQPSRTQLVFKLNFSEDTALFQELQNSFKSAELVTWQDSQFSRIITISIDEKDVDSFIQQAVSIGALDLTEVFNCEVYKDFENEEKSEHSEGDYRIDKYYDRKTRLWILTIRSNETNYLIGSAEFVAAGDKVGLDAAIEYLDSEIVKLAMIEDYQRD